VSRVYFTDRDLGKQFPARLREAGLQVERHTDHFEPSTPDADWLQTAGQRGWVVITRAPTHRAQWFSGIRLRGKTLTTNDSDHVE